LPDQIFAKNAILDGELVVLDGSGNAVLRPDGRPRNRGIRGVRTIRGTKTWIKVKNPKYTQAEGPRELFNKRG